MTASTRAATHSAAKSNGKTTTNKLHNPPTKLPNNLNPPQLKATTTTSRPTKRTRSSSRTAVKTSSQSATKLTLLAETKSLPIPNTTTIPTRTTTWAVQIPNTVIPPSPRAQRYDKRKRMAEDSSEGRSAKRCRSSSSKPTPASPIPSTSKVTLDMDVDSPEPSTVASTSKTTLDDTLPCSTIDSSKAAVDCDLDVHGQESQLSDGTESAKLQSDANVHALSLITASVKGKAPITCAADDAEQSLRKRKAVEDDCPQSQNDISHNPIYTPFQAVNETSQRSPSPPSDEDGSSSESSDDMLTETPDADGIFVLHTAPASPPSPPPAPPYPNITADSFVPERPTRLSPLSCTSFTLADHASSSPADMDADADLDEEYDDRNEIPSDYFSAISRRQHRVDPDLWKLTMQHRVSRIAETYTMDLIRELVEEEAARLRDYRDEEPYDFELDESDEESDEWESVAEKAREPEMIVFSAASSPEPIVQDQVNPQPYPPKVDDSSLVWPPPRLSTIRVPDLFGFNEGWRVRGTPVDRTRRAVWASPTTPRFNTASPAQLYNNPPQAFIPFTPSPPTSPPLQTFTPQYAQAPPPSPASFSPSFASSSEHSTFPTLEIDPTLWDQFIETLKSDTFVDAVPRDAQNVSSPPPFVDPGVGVVSGASGLYAGPVESFTEMLYATEEAF